MESKLSDWELWAAAAFVEKQYGDRAPHFITERMLTLSQLGDEEGVATWQGISERYDMLTGRTPHQTN
jgi:hypothetical protein